MPTYADGRGEPCGIGSGTSEKEMFHQKRRLCGRLFLIRLLRQRQGAPHCAALPQEAAKASIIQGGRKRVLVLGKVRADGALTQRVSAAGCCTAQSASVPCAFRDAVGCFGHCVLHGEVWWRSLPPAPRSSALWHGPPMPRRGAGVVFEFSSQGVSIPCFGLCVRTHTEGACSLFVHLHLNREWNPCPCRSSRYLGASFPFSPPPPLMRSPSPARAGEAEMVGYSLPSSLRGSGQPLPITLRLSACVLGRFSHTTCYPLSDTLRACFSDRSVSGVLVFSTSPPAAR